VASSVVTRKTAALVRDAVVEAVDPVEIILFGSVAQAASGNDLDLLVVTEDRDGPPDNDRPWLGSRKTRNIHRLLAIAEDHRLPVPLHPADVDFMDEVYRGRCPAESGLLPLGTATRDDADRARSIAKRVVVAMHETVTKRE